MTNTQRVLEYLGRIAPKPVTNADIRSATRIEPHQQVFQITNRLMNADRIKGRQFGKEWHFWMEMSAARCG